MSPNAIQILAITFGIIGFAGGTVGYFAKGRGDSIIAYQAREIELRDGTISRLEKDNAGLVSENKTLREQNAILQGLAQGSPELIKLTKEIKHLAEVVAKGNKS